MKNETPLDSAMVLYRHLLSRKNYGVNSPVVRQLQQVIKLAFGNDGANAIAAARREASVTSTNTNALLKRTVSGKKDQGSEKKRGVSELLLGKELRGRELRNLLRGQVQQDQTELQEQQVEELEKGQKVAVEADGIVTPSEVKDISEMSPKDIVDLIGPNRIDATLLAAGEELKGSERQRAAKLKKLLLSS